jgi:H+-translocating NAD(P) transhydrogenase subunit alpha
VSPQQSARNITAIRAPQYSRSTRLLAITTTVHIYLDKKWTDVHSGGEVNEMTVPTHPIVVGVLSERVPGERRVALIPADVKKLIFSATFVVEAGAGSEAGFKDEAYVNAGARIAESRDLLESCDVVVKVRPPSIEETPRAGGTLISLGGHDPELEKRLRRRSVIHLALERVPRTSRAQPMDALSSQASIADYAAVIEGARGLNVLLPMLTTAAGTIKPARMIALGAGVAGLQAIASARRLGAVVHGFDVRAAAREQVESRGATFVSVEGMSARARRLAAMRVNNQPTSRGSSAGLSPRI